MSTRTTSGAAAASGAAEPTRVERALDAWELYRWTNALLATDSRPTRPNQGPLQGLLFSAKDVFASSELPTTAGSLVLRDHRPSADAVAISRLRQAGATLFAKSNCAEFGIGIHTETRLGGRVHHPFEPSISPGGSSGGDAVAVATGIVDFAIGADYGGSVRWPAQSVGVYGLRTTPGLVPRTGVVPGTGARQADPCPSPPVLWSLQGQLEVVGLLAADLGILTRALAALSGSDGEDWAGLGADRPASRGDRRRLAVTLGTEVSPVDETIIDRLTEYVERARAVGYEIVRVDGLLEGAPSLYAELRRGLDDLSDLRRLVDGKEDLLCAGTLAALAEAPPPGPFDSAVRDCWVEARRVVRRIRAVFDEADALLVPVAPVRALGHGAGATLSGRVLQSPADLMCLCRAISLTGCPALSVPLGAKDLENGGRHSYSSVQIVGPPGSELVCCEIARAIDAPLAD